MKKDLCNQECGACSVNIQDSASGVQIQQGAVNSSQFQNVNQEFDFDKAAEVLHEISKFIPMFADTYGQDCKIAEKYFSKGIKQSDSNRNFRIIKTNRDLGFDIMNLLRKAYLVARKLKLQEFEDWVNNELNGYKDLDKIPDYRLLRGELKAWNTYHGWIPVILQNDNEKITTHLAPDSLANLLKVYENS